jgi:small neutral amino acid transporter SnatA (MarC family)
MNHCRIERIATELSVLLLFAVAVLATVAFADGFFRWNLLDGLLEQVAGFLIAALAVHLLAAGLASIVLNLRRIGLALERGLEAAAERADRP